MFKFFFRLVFAGCPPNPTLTLFPYRFRPCVEQLAFFRREFNTAGQCAMDHHKFSSDVDVCVSNRGAGHVDLHGALTLGFALSNGHRRL